MKILIIRVGNIGDVLMSTPFLRKAYQSFPDVTIDFVCSAHGRSMLDKNQFVRNIFIYNKFKGLSGLIKRYFLIQRLRQEAFDAIFILEDHPQYKEFAYSISSKALKVGFSGEGDHWLNQKVDSSKDTHLILNYLNLLKGAFGISIDPEDLWMDLALPDWPKNQERLKIHGKYIILHPGTTGYLPLRSWSPEGYAGIIGFLQHRGFHILITGQKAHQSMIEELLSFSKDVPKEKVTCLMDKSLDELIYYINGASAVVCSDTGVLHMAMALKVPVLGLFGPSNPAHTGPVGPGRYDVIRNDFQCGPCNYSSSYRMEDKKNCLDGKPPACMKSITAEQVITGLKNLLKI